MKFKFRLLVETPCNIIQAYNCIFTRKITKIEQLSWVTTVKTELGLKITTWKVNSFLIKMMSLLLLIKDVSLWLIFAALKYFNST